VKARNVALLWLVWAGVVAAGSAAGGQTWPTPTDIPEAVAGVESPGGAGRPAIAGAAAAAAPAIAAISDTTYPDETLVITGEGLAGATLRVWAEGATFDIRPLRSAANRMQAVVPRDAPCATMLVWPVKAGMAGAPIRVNGATSWWTWPARVEAGIDGNTSEQYLFHVGDRDGGLFRVVQGEKQGAILEERAASMLAQSVVTRPWTTTMDRAGRRRDGDWAMFVAGGRGVGQWRLLAPESAGVNLRVRKPWRIIPDATSTVLVQRVFRNNILCNNVINPSPDPADGGDSLAANRMERFRESLICTQQRGCLRENANDSTWTADVRGDWAGVLDPDSRGAGVGGG